MPHWLIKTALHRIIHAMPYSQWWNEWFQRYVTRSLELSATAFEDGLVRSRAHLENFLRGRQNVPEDFTVLELGTGWFPLIPISLFLCGASEIWTFDIVPLLRHERLKLLLDYFCDFDKRGVLKAILPRVQPERMELMREALANMPPGKPEDILRKFRIHALIREAADTGLPSSSVNLFFSTTVLEYVPVQGLSPIFAEFKRLAKPDALMSHYIVLRDQFASFDQSLSPFNFLKYSERRWKYFDSPLISQNRLRIADYRRLIIGSGWKILQESNTSGSIEELRAITLAPQFQSYSTADLLVLTSWMTAVPAGKL